ncbi:MAG: class I tRNA ligase family protein [Candidatus Promineifilaceae bacterium]
MEHKVLEFWKESDAFNELRRLRAETEATHGTWSFVDGPITANNPMGVHHAWGRTYKDLYNRYHAMLGKNLRWQQGFDCQGLWVEVNAEKELGFKNKRDIEAYGLAKFTDFCKSRVLHHAARQTEQSIRLGYWMDWNDPEKLHELRDLMREDASQVITVEGPNGPVTDTVEQIVGRLGMAELGGSYFTFSNENNYQIWAFLKETFERGWMYKGRDVMPYCARCGTGISQHEIVTDGYQNVTHESIFLRFPLVGREKTALLVWTTTPWTLSSNVAAAVGPEVDYVEVSAPDGWTYYLAEGAMKNTLIGKQSAYEVVNKLKGEAMVGWEYSAPFDHFSVVKTAFAEMDYRHRIISWKDVGAEEGTGIVHIAPGCGAEDFGLSKDNNLPVLAPLDENGYFVAEYEWQTGQSVFDVKDAVFDHLRKTDTYYRKQKYTHRYPHCWRCGTELVYRLVDEWYINMGDLYDKPREDVTPAEKEASFRYQIMDSVGQANWYPSFGHDREMDWLRNMHDWMISKKRYYGLALPIYEFEDGSFYVVGSLEELEKLAVEGWDEFEGHAPHRPYIDAVKIAHPESGLIGTRIKDVGNPWLDAGIVAISTLRLSSDKEYWNKWYPADWISESFPGQFRNWFYSLLAQSTLMSQTELGEIKGPFRNLFSYGTLYAEDGREMHKSWGNAIWFDDGVEKMGADTMRWLYASCLPEKNLRFGYGVGDETRRRFLIPLWNVYSFFVTYARLDGWKPDVSNTFVSDNAANAQLDEWIRERVKETAVEMGGYLDTYDAMRATKSAESLLDDLSNWYVRRSRRRFWRGEMDADKQAAYETLYYVLMQFMKLIAPIVPFTAEEIYQNLASADESGMLPKSVHHNLYPRYSADSLNQALLDKMRLAITAASLGRAARGGADIKLRQPLATARINVGTQQAQIDLEELADVLAEEINVKQIEVVSDVGDLVSYKVLPNNRLLGPKFGRKFGAVRGALMKMDAGAIATSLQTDGEITFEAAGESVTLTSEEILVQTEAKGDSAVASDKGVTVAVDTQLTPELMQEGFARDLVRNLNNARKEAGYQISDRIAVWYQAEGDVAAAFANFAAYIQAETLAELLTVGEGGDFSASATVGGQSVVLGLSKV